MLSADQCVWFSCAICLPCALVRYLGDFLGISCALLCIAQLFFHWFPAQQNIIRGILAMLYWWRLIYSLLPFKYFGLLTIIFYNIIIKDVRQPS